MNHLIALMGLTLAAPDPAAVVTAADAAGESFSVWDFIIKGGWMMIPIGLCSLVALTVFIERVVSLRRSRVIPRGFVDGLRRRLTAGDGGQAAALAYCRENESPIANVFAAGIKRLGAPEEVITRHVDEAGRREVLHLRKYLRVFSVIAAVAPLLGLLGTIMGMIKAFRTVATSAEALGRTELLAEGIYEAMVTTAAGLVVAIPALIAYHWLTSRVQRLVMDIDETTVVVLEDPTAPEPDSQELRAETPVDVADAALAT